jgi:ABC-2 type transport system ATP-binding protein
MIRLLVAVIAVLLSACNSSSSSGTSSQPAANHSGLTAAIVDAVVPSKADGTEIALTAFLPDLAPGETAPLLIHGHGWVLSRTKDFESTSPIDQVLGIETSVQVAKKAFEAGYFVISFDQRGWGESGGNVELMDPDLEGLDVSSIIDWAVANYGPYISSEGGDPLIGAVGISYGGGFQTIGAAVDDRFDAIVPIITWNDLRYSLFPNNVPKSVWDAILVLTGIPTSRFSLAPDIYEAFIAGLTTMNPSQEFSDKLYNNSPVSFCDGLRADGRGVPDVDVLFVQGTEDVLFNATEGWRNYECFKQAGNDARIILQRDGHLVSAVQQSGQLLLFGMQETVYCGDQSYDTLDVMFRFLDEKLRGGAPTGLPNVCLSQMEKGQALAEMPVGGFDAAFEFDNLLTGVAIETVLGLLLDLDPGALLTVLNDLPTDVSAVVRALVNGFSNPSADEFFAVLPALLNVLPSELVDELVTYQHFVPLYQAGQGKVLAGVPTVKVDLTPELSETPVSDPVVFLGLAVDPADGSGRYLVHDQVTPMRGFQSFDLEMSAASLTLQPGDVLGVVAMTFHTQFVSSFSRVPELVHLNGVVSLPIINE